MASNSYVRTACGLTVTVAPMLDVATMYEDTYTRVVRLYDVSGSLGALPASRATLYYGRLSTLRLALREIDENGFETAVDITSLTPYLRLHKRQQYHERGDYVMSLDFPLVKEVPYTDGLCYFEFDEGVDSSVPVVGEYIAEVAYKSGDNYATFAMFTVYVKNPFL